MLFKPDMLRAILADEKTQTRRMVRSDDCTPSRWKAAAGDPVPVEVVWQDGESVSAVLCDGPRLRYGVGKTYAVQPGRGKPAVARILVEQIRYCARADTLGEDDAHAEGFEDAAAFRAYYARLNGADALDKPCWALTFHLIEEEGA
jgi:hypothetical protein